jgi:hypothetical protein
MIASVTYVSYHGGAHTSTYVHAHRRAITPYAARAHRAAGCKRLRSLTGVRERAPAHLPYVRSRTSRRAPPSRWRSAARGRGDADHHGDDDREGEDAQRRGGRRLVVDAALRPRSKQRCESGPRSEQPWQESSSTQGCTRDGSGAACAGPRSGPEGAHPLRRQCSDVLPST